MKKYLFIICLLSCSWLYAQTFEEQFRQFQQQAEKEYADFRDEANQKYADFLRGAWEYYRQTPAIPQPEDEPVPPVVYNDNGNDNDNGNVISIEVLPIPEPAPIPQPVAPIEQNSLPNDAISITYQGTPFSFRAPETRIHLTASDKETLAKAWETMSGETYDNLLYDCLHQRDERHLCDWAYIELLGTLSHHLYGANNEATLLHAFLLAQSGYAMRLAQTSTGSLYVLVGSQYQLYNVGYFEMDGLYFYPLTDLHDGVQICSAAFQGEHPFSLLINPEQSLSDNNNTSTTRTSKSGIEATCTINMNAIHFYNTYPTGQVGGDCGTRWATYANAPMEECVRQSLYPTLMQAIRGVSEVQAVSKLLHWVQTAFEYEYDDKVWGQDRAFFPSETLHYPYADCEDRAILFSRIVRDLMKLDVVLLYYPGHLATAVAIHQDVHGDYIVLNGRKYIVCDPTYIGAPIGQTMPGMDNKTAKVIVLQR